jgi:hypothetical protein
MIDKPSLRIGADDHGGHTDSVAYFIHPRRRNVVIEATPIVPSEKNRRAVPLRTLQDLIDDVA